MYSINSINKVSSIVPRSDLISFSKSLPFPYAIAWSNRVSPSLTEPFEKLTINLTLSSSNLIFSFFKIFLK